MSTDERQHAAAYFLFALCGRLCYADVEHESVEGLLVEVELVAAMALGHVGNVEAAKAVGRIPLDGEKVEGVLDIFYRVDMSVDVDVVLVGVDGSHQLRPASHLHP